MDVLDSQLKLILVTDHVEMGAPLLLTNVHVKWDSEAHAVK